jgi:hypothetical protein
MTKVRPAEGVALPNVTNPAPEDAVRRDWIEANIAGGGSPEVIRDSVAPAEPHSYKVWIDTSTTPPTVREWTGTAWQTLQADPSAHNHDATYVNESDHTKAAHDALGIDAATLDGIDSTGFAPASHVGSRDGHPLATATADGMMAGADKAKLNAIGAITTLQRSTLLSVADRVWTSVPYETEVEDEIGAWAAATPARLTAPATATYMINAYSVWSNSSTAGVRTVRLLRSDGVVAGEVSPVSAGVDQWGRAWITVPVKLLAGQYVEVQVWQNSGAALDFGQTAAGIPSAKMVRL